MSFLSRNIVDIFLDVANSYPNQIAIELHDQTWTYGELLINAIRIRDCLQINEGEIVYHYVDRSIEMVCGILAIICAGGVYCPLNPSELHINIEHLINQTQGQYIIVNENTVNKLSKAFVKNIKTINLTNILSSDFTATNLNLKSGNPCYLVYTTDKNGEHKLIVHTNESILVGLDNLITWDIKYGEKVLQVASSSWSIHLLEILMPISSVPAGTLVLLPPEGHLNMNLLYKTIEEKEITISFISPSLLKMLNNYCQSNANDCSKKFERIRILWISGEPFKPRDAVKVKYLFTQTRLFSIFHINETNAAIGREIKETTSELEGLNFIPIGNPLKEYECFLIDQNNNQKIMSSSNKKQIGQICLRGRGLFKNYYRNPELTTNSRVTIDNKEYFKTNDLGRYDSNGEIIHIGQIDSQIKINNELIDTNQIEKTIIEFCPSEFRDCLIVESPREKDILLGYIVSKNRKINTESFIDYCKTNLRQDVTPHCFFIIDNFPLDEKGKLDKQRLLLPPIKLNSENSQENHLITAVNTPSDDTHKDERDHLLNAQTLANDNQKLPFEGFMEKSLFCLGQKTFPRYQCLKLVTWSWFERISMFVIVLNCITLGLYKPCGTTQTTESWKTCDTKLCFWLDAIDLFVFLFFTIEMLIKMVAMGVVGKRSYLADSWNRLDCFIVITGIVELLIPGDSVSLSAIRTVRVLRPLRAINRIPSMRILVMLLLDTLPMLGNVLLICFFIFFVFGIVGVQLWKGVLRNRCFLEMPTTNIDYKNLFDDFPVKPFYVDSDENAFICSDLLSNGMTKCSEIPAYHRDETACHLDLNSYRPGNGCINWNQYYTNCSASNENPYAGAINFDNIGFAWLTIFQIITLENWCGIMYDIQDAHSFWNWIYFIILIFIGSFFMMNLFLVVISAQFSVTKKRETERMLAEQKRFEHSTDFQEQQKKVSCWKTIRKYCQRICKCCKVTTETSIHRNNVPTSDNFLDLSLSNEEQNNKSPKRNSDSKFKKLRNFVSHLVEHKYFDRIIFLIILLNTITMAVEYHGQSELMTNTLEYINFIFIFLFTMEMIIKLISYGVLKYVKDPFNLFDTTIVIISFIELFQTSNSGLSVLRTFRLLRVIKLLRFLPTLRKQLVVMVRTLDSVATFFLLLSLCIFIFSILGMHLFGGKFCTIEGFNETSREKLNIDCRCCSCIEFSLLENSTEIQNLNCKRERTNFDSLLHALLTVFQILTQEDWNEVLYNGMSKTNSWSALYFIILMIFGNYVLLNLFIAILVESFQDEKEQVPSSINLSINDLDRVHPFKTEAIITGHLTQTDHGAETRSIRDAKELPEYVRRTHSDRLFPIKLTENFIEFESNKQLIPYTRTRSASDNVLHQIESNEKELGNVPKNNSIAIDLVKDSPEIIQSDTNEIRHSQTLKCSNKRKEYSLWIFSPSNKFRRLCQRLIAKKGFDYVILVFIVLNCITLAMERPSISPTSYERKLLNYSNYVFVFIFTVEMILKIIALGLFIGPNSYLRSRWNMMDGFLVVISILDLILSNRHSVTISPQSKETSDILGMLRVLRLLRALRPLRVINRAQGLKLVIHTLATSLRPIGYIFIICFLFFVIFGILGVQLFKGKFYYCDGPKAEHVKTREECESMTNHRWINQQYNFDHLGQALLTLFVLSSKDGWVTIMHNGIDAVDVDKQPEENYSEARSIYFIAFLLVVGFCVLNMFVGVVVENFHNCQAQIAEEEEEQNRKKREEELERRRQLLNEVPYYSNYSPLRKRLHDLCINTHFDLFIAAIIGLNVLTMSFEYYLMPPSWELFLEICNYIFTIIFLIEFIWKIIALGPKRYFRDSWNQLDALIVVLSIGAIFIEKLMNDHALPINATLVRVVRVFRIARVLKLLKMARGIRELLDTVIQALPQVGNLGLLFFLIFFIFATLGVELFGKIECDEDKSCNGFDKHAHFKNFGIALLTLFRVSTGDNWNGIMKDTLPDDSSTSHGKNYFMSIISPLYFVVFVLVTQFVLVNIVIAVLMKNLEDSHKMHDNESLISIEIQQQKQREKQMPNDQGGGNLDDTVVYF